MNARYYDPANGRFISQDSYRGEMNDPGQWHLYAYCANNPINYVDPSGHWPISIKYRYITRSALGNIIDGIMAFIGGGAVIFPVKKMAQEIFREYIRKGKKTLLKNKLVSKANGIKYKITTKISTIYNKMLNSAEKIKSKTLKKGVK